VRDLCNFELSKVLHRLTPADSREPKADSHNAHEKGRADRSAQPKI
jgi:hypothetical protein